MAPGKRALTGEEHDQFPGAARGLSAGMTAYCPRGDHGTVASRSGTETEIRVLAVHKEGRVEAIKLVPEFALYQHKRTSDDRDGSLFIGVRSPRPRRLRIEKPAPGQERAQAKREA
jgi:hypothetical protein